MQWDLGVRGVALLLLMSLVFGAVAQLAVWRSTIRWMWAVGAGAYFLFGVLISEVWFGWATEEELQPNIDGLSYDETLLAIFPSIVVVIVARYVMRRRLRRAV